MRIEFVRTSSFGNRTVVDECRLPMEPLLFVFGSGMLMEKGTSPLVRWMVPRWVLGSDSYFRMALHLEFEMEILKELQMAVVMMSKAVLMEKPMAWEKL